MPVPACHGAPGAGRPAGTALVLTAGLGTRLRPLSFTRAKPAVPVAGQALVRRIIRWLTAHGVRDLVLNLHYRPETITAEIGDGSDLGARVRFSWEASILGSAGGPRLALPLLDAGRFFVVNGDTLTDMDVGPLAEAHASGGALATLAVIENRWPDRYGGVLADEHGVVRGFVPRGSGRPSLLFVGVQAVERSVFALLPAGRPADSIRDVYAPLAASRPGSVRVFRCRAGFRDVGTPADYLATALAVGRAEGLVPLPVGRGCRVHPSARIVDTAVWDGVDIGEGVELVRCVVGDGARIPDGARFEDCAIVPAGGLTPGDGERLVGGLLVAGMPPHHGHPLT